MAAVTPPELTPFTEEAPQRGDRATFRDRVDAFVTWMIAAVLQFAALAQNVYANALDAFDSAQSAEAARALAVTAAQNALATPSAAGTSSTLLQLGFGAKSLTLEQLDRTFSLGQIVTIAALGNPRNWMAGEITAFTPSTGAMSVNVRNVGQDAQGVYPTIATWVVALSGPAAQTAQQQALSFAPVPMAANDMDLTQGEWFKKTITGNTAFSWSNVPQPPYGKAWVLELTITAGMVSFPAAIRWAGGLTPTMLAGKTHLIVLTTTDGGTSVRAAVLAGYAS